MRKTTLLTIGTTPINLKKALTGETASIASQTFGLLLNDQCREITYQNENGTIYDGDNAQVSSTNHGLRLLTGETKTIRDDQINSLNISDHWLVAGAAGALLAVDIITI